MNGTVLAATMAAPSSPAEPAEAAAKKCKKGTVLVKTTRKTRCVKLRVNEDGSRYTG